MNTRPEDRIEQLTVTLEELRKRKVQTVGHTKRMRLDERMETIRNEIDTLKEEVKS